MIMETVQIRKASVPGRAGDAADREQDEGGNAARHPEGAAPVDVTVQLPFGRLRNGSRVVLMS